MQPNQVHPAQPGQGAVDQWGNQVPQQPGYAAAPQVDAYGQPIAQAQPQYAQAPVQQAPVQQAPAPIIINIQQNWAPAPVGVPSSVPQGLEYLYFVDRLYIKQQVELFEVFTEFETSNRYQILNSEGRQCYFAGEQSGCIAKQCCGSNRDFEMSIADNQGKEVARFSRPFKLPNRCCVAYPPCMLQEMDVTTNGFVVGKIRQVADWSRPVFSIQNAQDQEVLRLVGPVFPCGICSDVEFDVITSEGVVVGKVSKKWGGDLENMAREMFTDADNFGVTFPIDLDATVKLSLMGCVFLIDFMFFEKSDKTALDYLCCILKMFGESE